MTDSPVLPRIKYSQPHESSAQRKPPLVQRRFPWTVAARGLLAAIACGWMISGIVTCIAMLIASSQPDVPAAGIIALQGFSELLTSLTAAALLMAGSEVLYGVACWLAANGSPENGERDA